MAKASKGQRRQGGRSGRRAPSKPLIIDVEAASEGAAAKPPSSPGGAVDPTPSKLAPSPTGSAAPEISGSGDTQSASKTGASASAGASSTRPASVTVTTEKSASKSPASPQTSAETTSRAATPSEQTTGKDKQRSAQTTSSASPSAGQTASTATASGTAGSKKAEQPTTDAKSAGSAAKAADKARDPASHGSGGNAKTPDAQKPALAAATQAAVNLGGGTPAGGPSAFYLFAAGLVGGLIALVLLFLAQLLGIFSLPDGRIDAQRLALVETEERLSTRIAAVEASLAEVSTSDVGSALELLREDLDGLALQVEGLSVSDASGLDLGALTGRLEGQISQSVQGAVAPLAARLEPLEALIGEGVPAGEPGQLAPEISNDLMALRAEVDALTELLGAAAQPEITAEGTGEAGAVGLANEAAQSVERIDALEGLFEAASTQIEAIDGRLGSLEGAFSDVEEQIATLDGGLANLDGSVSSLGESMAGDLGALGATVAEMAAAVASDPPDRLARLGVALDAVVDARDRGDDLAAPITAATSAAGFDDALFAAFEPLSALDLPGALNQSALMAGFAASRDAMIAAIPTEGGAGGMLGALGERARQLVSIQSPDGPVGEASTVTGQIDQLGSLLAAGDYGGALDAVSGLPEPVAAAAENLRADLQARVALDSAIAMARDRLIQALAGAS